MENNLSIIKDQFKELPNNIEAEQAVIGSILVSNEIFDEINTIISSINFYDPMHQKIFEAVEKIKAQLSKKDNEKKKEASQIAEQINGKEYSIKKLSTENNELYGLSNQLKFQNLFMKKTKLI